MIEALTENVLEKSEISESYRAIESMGKMSDGIEFNDAPKYNKYTKAEAFNVSNDLYNISVGNECNRDDMLNYSNIEIEEANYYEICDDLYCKNGEQTKNSIDGIDEYINRELSIYEDLTLSTYEERLAQTPSMETNRGNWMGVRGESKFVSSNQVVNSILSKFNLDSISYRRSIPDFSKCASSTVKIENMTEKRLGAGGNFEQCDTKCATQWNKEMKAEKTDWSARDVKNWREQNGYSWHERNDMETCDLVPTEINDYFGHVGGVSECRKRDNCIRDDFDE